MTQDVDWTSPPVAPENGKRYVMRNGEVTGPSRRDGYAHMASGEELRWHSSGEFHRNFRHPYDFIREYVPPAPPLPKEIWVNEYGGDPFQWHSYPTERAALLGADDSATRTAVHYREVIKP